ncbi:LuxR C-terminal-related transcriptional regulator [Microvirga puerhi]|uniref:Response regulator transcription factor n=1 Tax=Microvirga puerhi TaxID=2876078 RepID=A0ABS7VTU2_9HYPH|nr:response regulator transcription factor [Microvirga puerhi]MBZ6078367.1 response regulator transcription factor [Microvirga puerhi]
MRKNYSFDSLSNLDSLVPNETFSKSSDPQAHGDLDRTLRADTDLVPMLLIEPNTLLREGLKRILTDTRFQVLQSCSSFEEARSRQLDQAVMLIVSAGSDHENVFRQIKQFKAERNAAKVVVLVDHYDLREVLSAFQSGVDAYLVKSVSCEVLVKSLDLVMLGEAVYPAAILSLVHAPSAETEEVQEDPDEALMEAGSKLGKRGLSLRETVILRCLMQGDSNKIIARKFDITEATVKVHVKAILRKIRAKNRTQAAIWAASHLRSHDHVDGIENSH